jgi:Ca2+-binding RTX toxin-like protein
VLDRGALQREGWYRGDDNANTIWGENLNDTYVGGKGDDYLRDSGGSDTYIWHKGDGNDTIWDSLNSATDVDTLVLADVSVGDVMLSYEGDTLLIKINDTGEVIQVGGVFSGADNLLTDYNFRHYGIEQIQFASGEIWDRQQIYLQTGHDYIGKHFQTTSLSVGGLLE